MSAEVFVFNKEMSDKYLFDALSYFNKEYRNGTPVITDHEYDFTWMEEALSRFPERNHPFFDEVEPEDAATFGNAKVKHPIPMLSTLKVYTKSDENSFVKRVSKAAKELGIKPSDVMLSVNAKLDGMSGRQLNGVLVTRGESGAGYGYDVSGLFSYGVKPASEPEGCLSVVGEVVCNKEYYTENLSEEFDHPRGVVVGLASSAAQNGTPNVLAMQAAKDGAIVFQPYSDLPETIIKLIDLPNVSDQVYKDITGASDFPLDGIVISVVDERIKEYMGHSKTSHRWQIAKKVKGEQKEARVIGVNWQTSRTGNINPVVQIEPTQVSGCVIENPTGHHAGRVRDWGINTGALILISRSGEVIPNIDRVIEPKEADIPDCCPSCGSEVEWKEPANPGEDSKFLYCPNMSGCNAQKERSMIHFFDIMGNVDSFGPATIHKLVEAGINSLPEIFNMSKDFLVNAGFGVRQSEVLIEQANRCRTTPVEDWRFLGAFGIHLFGRGSAERVLKVFDIDELNTLSVDDLKNVELFADVKATKVHDGIQKAWSIIDVMLHQVGFNLTTMKVVESKLTGMGVVFTGAMQHGKRDDMKKEAKQLGAKVQSSVSKNTSLLVCGERVGTTKTNKAKELGVRVITEEDYLNEFIA